MAGSGDKELILNEQGDLVSLFKKDLATGKESKQLLTPEQVAKCIKFIWLKPYVDDDGLPQVRASPYSGDVSGLKVNVFGGATGSGKTSLIRILAGGIQTDAKFCSDTKCPAVYLYQHEDSVYALLDTAGMCDTQAAAVNSIGLQELLINSVAAGIQAYKLEVMSFAMCVDSGSRLLPDFWRVWPQMQISLGGDALEKRCCFVMTKVNADSKVDKIQAAKFNQQTTFQALVHSSLGWPVVHAGRENLHDLLKLLQPITSSARGIDGRSMDSHSKSLTTHENEEKGIKGNVNSKRQDISNAEDDARRLSDEIKNMNEKINDAYEELASQGNCRDAEKQRIRGEIDDAKRRLRDLEDSKRRGQSTASDLRRQLMGLNDDLEKKRKEIAKMHNIGDFFRKLLTVGS